MQDRLYIFLHSTTKGACTVFKSRVRTTIFLLTKYALGKHIEIFNTVDITK